MAIQMKFLAATLLTLLVLGPGCSDGVGNLGGDDDDQGSECDDDAAEVCNGIDDDCDGEIDEGLPLTAFADTDGDGYGDPAGATIDGCGEDGSGFVGNSDDCDDTLAEVNPAAEEICNGRDDNCSGVSDEGFDGDGDGFGDCLDCDDDDPTIYPEAEEVCDGIDQNCDGIADLDFEDTDGDGEPNCLDEDDDNDGFLDVDDCGPTNDTVFPGAAEVCANSVDDDCDPLTTCFTITHGPITTTVQSVPGTVDAISWYEYGIPDAASANTGMEIADRSLEFIYIDPTDEMAYLVIIHDIANDATGGNSQILVTGAVGGSVVFMDDPTEGGLQEFDPLTGSGTLTWAWLSCCTDGAIIGPFNRSLCVSLEWIYGAGIDGITTMDGNNVLELGPFTDPITFCPTP